MRYKGRLKRRHKRILAAVAGAAVMSSALLPGMPIARAATPATAAAPATATATSASLTSGSDPVQVVNDNASSLGLDSNGRYSLIKQGNDSAVVRVRSNGQTYKVDLIRRGDTWVVQTLRGIGDMTHPATYIPASMLGYSTLTPAFVGQATTVVPATLAASQQVLYRNDDYNNWLWYESTYPGDMAFGAIMQNPALGKIAAPSKVLQSTRGLDYGRQFAVYAHLGTTAGKGYGIGIAQVVQTGNDITVLVRTKSPQPNTPTTATKTDDVVTVDRASLNFRAPIHIGFIDQNGTELASYTVNPT